ncbi:phosphoenolpyruvate--protein phosphotransferase [Chitinibacteraceae bacterium HSL-7]
MAFSLQGIGIGGGVAIGHAYVLTHNEVPIVHYQIAEEAVAGELARFEHAVRHACQQLETLWGGLPANAPSELGAFLSLHIMLLNDHQLTAEPLQIIRTQRCNAEWALKQHVDTLLAQFDEIEEEYLRERRTDIVQVTDRIFKALTGHEGVRTDDVAPDSILVAHDLSPADMVLFKDTHFAGFLTDIGGPTSHTAILARSLDLPAVLALRNARHLIRNNDLLVVDGEAGVVIVDPPEAVLAEYRKRQRNWQKRQKALLDLRGAAAITRDGTEIELFANIELPDDAAHALENGATGIGLFRSEFLYLKDAADLPSEDEQFEAYKQVAEALDGQPVIIRTMDLGKDKVPKWQEESTSPNPALGLTGIRLCLAETSVFRTQLRALLRASAYGRIHLLLPMLSNLNEIKAARQQIEFVKAELLAEGVAVGEQVEVGGMIEVPAAALAVPHFLKYLDFISIGTNDLIQYTLAVDRSDDAVSHLYEPLHPAVIHLLHHIISHANAVGKPVAMCGEMAGDPKLTRLLLALGLRRFSMLPTQLLRVKQQLIDVDLAQLVTKADALLAAEDAEAVQALLSKMVH